MPHPVFVKRNLTWFFFDGLFANASDTIVITYLSLYVISLVRTKGQIGLMSSLASLSAAILLVPSALLVEKIGHRQEITLIFGGGLARLCILALAFLPLVASGGILVWLAIALAVLRKSSLNIGFPAWMSMTGDIIPLEGRGRYFGARNFIMGVASMAVTLIVGALITRSGAPLGYQIALVLAFLVGIVSTYCFSRLMTQKEARPAARRIDVAQSSIGRRERTPGIYRFLHHGYRLEFFTQHKRAILQCLYAERIEIQCCHDRYCRNFHKRFHADRPTQNGRDCRPHRPAQDANDLHVSHPHPANCVALSLRSYGRLSC